MELSHGACSLHGVRPKHDDVRGLRPSGPSLADGADRTKGYMTRTEASRPPVPTLRIARPTDQLDDVARMYTEGLGFEVLGRFQDHDGFDGVMLGVPGAAWDR